MDTPSQVNTPGQPGAPIARGPHRRRDYDQLPDQPRHELLFGRLYGNPSPASWHQVTVQELWLDFDRMAKASGGVAFLAPLDVHLADHSIVQPDILYVAAPRLGIVRDHIEGPPDLVVEVLAPGTAERDQGEKLLLYAWAAVQECWLVHREERRMEFPVNEGGRFVQAPYTTRRYRSPKIPEIHLNVDAFWRRLARSLSGLPPAGSG